MASGPPNEVAVHGTPAELFSLMLHDRLIELEAAVAGLRGADVDPRIELLDPAATQGRDVYVRVHCAQEQTPDTFAGGLCRRLGALWPGCSADVMCVQHYNLDATFVMEALVCFDAAKNVAQVARTALDAAQGLATGAKAQPVLACRVHSREWFVESIRAACGDSPWVWCWDKTQVVKEDLDAYIEDEGWSLLQGWLAHNREPVEVLHPLALHAQVQARKLWSLIARIV